MTNLQAMQDQRLQDLIYQVEQLQRLHKQVEVTWRDESFEVHLEALELEISEWGELLNKRWKELLEG